MIAETGCQRHAWEKLMSRRAAAVFAVTAGLVVSLGVSTVPAAGSAAAVPPVAAAVTGGSCSIVVPRTVWVDRPYKLIPTTWGSDCVTSGTTWATWGLRHSYYGPIGGFSFRGATSVVSNEFHDWYHYGTYILEPNEAYDDDYNDRTQNTPSYVVKSGSRISVSATRAKKYVTMRVSTSYYSPDADAFRPWKRDKVVLQYKTPGTSTWRHLRVVYTASNARASYRFYAPRTRYYRALSTATTKIWGRPSVAIRR